MCRVDPALFFHPANERGVSRSRRIARAKQICYKCPVLRQCRTHALNVAEPFGIWGGMSEEDRDRILCRGRAGRTGNRSA